MSDDLRGDFFVSESGGAESTTGATRDDFFSGVEPKFADSPKPPKFSDSPEKIAADMKAGKIQWPQYAERMQAWEKSRREGAPKETVGQGAAGILEAPLSLASSATAAIGGGLRGLYNLATGEGLDTAAEAARSSEEAGTYQPRTETGKALTGFAALPGQLLHEGAEAGAEATGRSELAPILEGAANIGLTLAGGRAALRRPSPGEAPSAPIAEAAEAAPSRGGFAGESVGAAASAPDLSRAPPHVKQAVQEMTQAGVPINRETLTRKLKSSSLPIPIQYTSGQLTQDVSRLSLEQNLRGKSPDLARHFQEQNQQLIDNLDEIRAGASPTMVQNDHIQNGQALIDSYKAADEPVRQNITALYKKLEAANGGQFPVNGKAFVESADAALAKKLKGRYLPPEVRGVLDDLRDGGNFTFENFENLRTDLASASRKADRSGDGNAAAAVNITREVLESLPMEGEAAAIKPIADAARSAAKARFERLRSDPAYRAAVDDAVGVGEASPLADDFVQKYLIKGKSANIKQMRENLANDPNAHEAIAAGVTSYLKSKSGVNLFTNEGNFSQAGFNKALSEVTPKIADLLPSEQAQQLQTLGDVARDILAQPRGSFVNNSNTFVAAAGAHLANVGEGMLNVAAKGVPVGSFIRKGLAGRAERKFVKETLTDVKLKDLLRAKAPVEK